MTDPMHEEEQGRRRSPADDFWLRLSLGLIVVGIVYFGLTLGWDELFRRLMA